ncbi:leucine-rich repeat and immunoglobulin-like domain-containing nogo receptor-interacting protein 4a [Osmerus eperlanus]|uniref:leucine-rich repeat and immunoglobulin-like domain-containing nogo receptor-interacting protein 4a n=1 Tax=Osmerus eperlanus TaxID=29151 RepID=UPI002E126BEE
MFVETLVQWWLCRVIIYILAASVVLAADTSWPCPLCCRCSSEVLEVNCSRCQFPTVPDGLSTDCQLLNLTYNKIKTLERQQFSSLTQLWDLDLSDNILNMIEAEAFLGLQNLLTLRIARNRLKIIPVGVFSGLTRLRLLDISQNEILVLLDFTFRDLAALQRIEAGENDLVYVSQRAFTGLSSLQELHLDHCNLTSVPTEALAQLSGLTRLRFRQLGLTTLPNNSFRCLGRLRELVVSHCPWLETLAENSLFGLNLTSLTICHCNLSTMPYTPLHHLVYLRYLDLSFNPITYIQGNRLRELLRLEELHLAGGGLLRIEPGAFRGLARFRLLNVSGNLLATLEEKAFHSVGNLETLRIDGNPLACDCRLLWVVHRRLYLDFGGRPPVCTAPVQVQGRVFRDFSEAELPGLFTCRQARILNRKPQQVRVDEGHTVLFYCSADGDPKPSIIWLSPQSIPLSPTGRIHVLPNNSLEVRYAQVQDSGAYRCVASNAAGNDSFAVGLQVWGFSQNHSRRLHPALSFPAGNGSSHAHQPFPFDAKTLLIAVTLGFLSFIGSVVICFIFMFFWSQGKGQIKHTATIDFVPRSTIASNGAGGGNRVESGRFTMKLI